MKLTPKEAQYLIKPLINDINRLNKWLERANRQSKIEEIVERIRIAEILLKNIKDSVE